MKPKMWAIIANFHNTDQVAFGPFDTQDRAALSTAAVRNFIVRDLAEKSSISELEADNYLMRQLNSLEVVPLTGIPS